MTGRADRARAVLTLTRRGDVVAFTGRLPQIPSVSDRWQPGGAACEYMAADASCAGPGWCDLADVIICGRRVRPASISALLTRVLGRYPGCAVAAASGLPGLPRHGDLPRRRVRGRLRLDAAGPLHRQRRAERSPQ